MCPSIDICLVMTYKLLITKDNNLYQFTVKVLTPYELFDPLEIKKIRAFDKLIKEKSSLTLRVSLQKDWAAAHHMRLCTRMTLMEGPLQYLKEMTLYIITIIDVTPPTRRLHQTGKIVAPHITSYIRHT